ncbi:hypothetical protein ACFL0T_04385, partial [Candidatus Omnitrophota bacterium]
SFKRSSAFKIFGDALPKDTFFHVEMTYPHSTDPSKADTVKTTQYTDAAHSEQIKIDLQKNFVYELVYGRVLSYDLESQAIYGTLAGEGKTSFFHVEMKDYGYTYDDLTYDPTKARKIVTTEKMGSLTGDIKKIDTQADFIYNSVSDGRVVSYNLISEARYGATAGKLSFFNVEMFDYGYTYDDGTYDPTKAATIKTTEKLGSLEGAIKKIDTQTSFTYISSSDDRVTSYELTSEVRYGAVADEAKTSYFKVEMQEYGYTYDDSTYDPAKAKKIITTERLGSLTGDIKKIDTQTDFTYKSVSDDRVESYDLASETRYGLTEAKTTLFEVEMQDYGYTYDDGTYDPTKARTIVTTTWKTVSGATSTRSSSTKTDTQTNFIYDSYDRVTSYDLKTDAYYGSTGADTKTSYFNVEMKGYGYTYADNTYDPTKATEIVTTERIDSFAGDIKKVDTQTNFIYMSVSDERVLSYDLITELRYGAAEPKKLFFNIEMRDYGYTYDGGAYDPTKARTIVTTEKLISLDGDIKKVDTQTNFFYDWYERAIGYDIHTQTNYPDAIDQKEETYSRYQLTDYQADRAGTILRIDYNNDAMTFIKRIDIQQIDLSDAGSYDEYGRLLKHKSNSYAVYDVLSNDMLDNLIVVGRDTYISNLESTLEVAAETDIYNLAKYNAVEIIEYNYDQAASIENTSYFINELGERELAQTQRQFNIDYDTYGRMTKYDSVVCFEGDDFRTYSRVFINEFEGSHAKDMLTVRAIENTITSASDPLSAIDNLDIVSVDKTYVAFHDPYKRASITETDSYAIYGRASPNILNADDLLNDLSALTEDDVDISYTRVSIDDFIGDNAVETTTTEYRTQDERTHNDDMHVKEQIQTNITYDEYGLVDSYDLESRFFNDPIKYSHNEIFYAQLGEDESGAEMPRGSRAVMTLSIDLTDVDNENYWDSAILLKDNNNQYRRNDLYASADSAFEYGVLVAFNFQYNTEYDEYGRSESYNEYTASRTGATSHTEVEISYREGARDSGSRAAKMATYALDEYDERMVLDDGSGDYVDYTEQTKMRYETDATSNDFGRIRSYTIKSRSKEGRLSYNEVDLDYTGTEDGRATRVTTTEIYEDGTQTGYHTEEHDFSYYYDRNRGSDPRGLDTGNLVSKTVDIFVDGVMLESQEIVYADTSKSYSSNYNYQGVALQVKTTRYGEDASLIVAEKRVRTSDDIDERGRIKEEAIYRYKNAGMSEIDMIEKQAVFYIYDDYNRVTDSEIFVWDVKDDGSMHTPLYYQKVHNDSFDNFGNALHTTIWEYEFDILIEDIISPATGLVPILDPSIIATSYKDITHSYDVADDDLEYHLKLKGKAHHTTTLLYDEYGLAGDLIERTEVDNKTFDRVVNVTYREAGTYRFDDGVETLATKTYTHSSDFDASGNGQWQHTWTYKGDEETFINYSVIQNMSFDHNGNAKEQKVLQFAEDVSRDTEYGTPDYLAPMDMLISAKHIINTNIDARGNIYESTVKEFESAELMNSTITFSDLMETQVIESAGFNPYGAARYIQIARFDDANLLISVEDTEVLEFYREKTLESVTDTYTTEGDVLYIPDAELNITELIPTLDLSETKRVINESRSGLIDFDIYGNSTYTQIYTWGYEGVVAKELDYQYIVNNEFDIYGNAISRDIWRYDFTSAITTTPLIMPTDADLLDYKETRLYFEGSTEVQKRRGNPKFSITWTWENDTKANDLLIDIVVSENKVFDEKGNPEHQIVRTYNDKDNFESEHKTGTTITPKSNTNLEDEKRVIYNDVISSRGNAEYQYISTYKRDTAGELKFTSYREVHNLGFDAKGNVKRQVVVDYAENSPSRTSGADAPEHSKPAQPADEYITSIRYIINSQFDSRGNVMESISYEVDSVVNIGLDTDSNTTEKTIVFIEKQVTHSDSFNSFGLALHTITERYDSENEFMESQVTTIEADDTIRDIALIQRIDSYSDLTRSNQTETRMIVNKNWNIADPTQEQLKDNFDLDGRPKLSQVYTWVYDSAGTIETLDYQRIDYRLLDSNGDPTDEASYDIYGNPLFRRIWRYEFTGDITSDNNVSSLTYDESDPLDYKEIALDFTDSSAIQKRKGNARLTTTWTWEDDSKTEDKLVDITVSENKDFDTSGNPTFQVSRTYYDEADYILDLANINNPNQDTEYENEKRSIYNEGINARGNAEYQYISTEKRKDGDVELTFISYRIVHNKDYDAKGNVKEQDILEFANQPDRNIATGEPDDKKFEDGSALILVSAKKIINHAFDSRGNALHSTIEEYTDGSFDGSSIYLDPADIIETQVIHSSDFDSFGLAHETYVIRYDNEGNLISLDHTHVEESDREKTLASRTDTYATDDAVIVVDENAIVSSLISQLDIIETKRIINKNSDGEAIFDVFGNATFNQIYTWGYDGLLPVAVDYQYIVNNEFDVYGNVILSDIWRYEFEGTPESHTNPMAVMGPMPPDSLLSTAKSSTHVWVPAHDLSGEPLDYKEVERDFTDSTEIEKRKGNARLTTTWTWEDDTKVDNLVDILVSENKVFDTEGNPTFQVSRTYYDESNYTLDLGNINDPSKVTQYEDEKRVIYNDVISSRGNAEYQYISTYKRDTAGELKFTSYREVHNLGFDAKGNVKRQVVVDYAENSPSRTSGADAPEHSKPAQPADEYITSIRYIINSQFDSRGNVMESISYEVDSVVNIGLDTDSNTTEKTIVFIEKQVTHSDSFNSFGLALHTITERYDSENEFMESQVTTIEADDTIRDIALIQRIDSYSDLTRSNQTETRMIVNKNWNIADPTQEQLKDNFDLDGRPKLSQVYTWVYDSAGTIETLDYQRIDYRLLDSNGDPTDEASYDIYGNPLFRRIWRYEFTGDITSDNNVSSLTYDESDPLDYKEIALDFTDSSAIQKRKGNARLTTTWTWEDDSKTEDKLVDITVSENKDFDTSGNPTFQVSRTYYDEADYILDLANINNPNQDTEYENEKRSIYNEGINARGNAEYQYISTEKRKDGDVELTFISYRIVHNKDYDAKGNVKEQDVLEFANQPDRNIATGAPDDKRFDEDGILVSARNVINHAFDSRGNVLHSTVIEYAEGEFDETAITMAGKVETRVIRSSNYNSYGLALDTWQERYNADDELVDVTHTVVSEYSRDNAVTQISFRYVAKDSTPQIELNDPIDIANDFILVDRTFVKNKNWDEADTPDKWAENFEFGNPKYSQVTTYAYDTDTTDETEVGTLVSYQRIYNRRYDLARGNVLERTIETYSDTDADNDENFIDFKVIINNFTDYPDSMSEEDKSRAAAKGNPATTTTYICAIKDVGLLPATGPITDIAISDDDFIKMTHTVNLRFDNNGNAVYTKTHSFNNKVSLGDIDPEDAFETKEIFSEGFDLRGNARTQYITTHRVDEEGTDTITSYVIMHNLQFDVYGNVLEQVLYEYADECDLGRHDSSSADYGKPYDANDDLLVSVKYIENFDVDSRGNRYHAKITEVIGIDGLTVNSDDTVTINVLKETNITRSSGFDHFGNATDIYAERYGSDDKLVSILHTHNYLDESDRHRIVHSKSMTYYDSSRSTFITPGGRGVLDVEEFVETLAIVDAREVINRKKEDSTIHFDKYDRTEYSQIYVYDVSIGLDDFVVLTPVEYQYIHNKEHDLWDNVIVSETEFYELEQSAAFDATTDMQVGDFIYKEITTREFIDPAGASEEEVDTDQEILWRSRQQPSRITTKKYGPTFEGAGTNNTEFIEKVVTDRSEFNDLGISTVQMVSTHRNTDGIRDETTAEIVTQREIKNYNDEHPGLGHFKDQKIWEWRISDGLNGEPVKVLVNYSEIENSEFDMNGNANIKITKTFSDDTIEKELISVYKLDNDNSFTPRGWSTRRILTSYDDESLATELTKTVSEMSNFTPRGVARDETITTYDMLLGGEFQSRQILERSSIDPVTQNVLETITRFYNDENAQADEYIMQEILRYDDFNQFNEAQTVATIRSNHANAALNNIVSSYSIATLGFDDHGKSMVLTNTEFMLDADAHLKTDNLTQAVSDADDVIGVTGRIVHNFTNDKFYIEGTYDDDYKIEPTKDVIDVYGIDGVLMGRREVNYERDTQGNLLVTNASSTVTGSPIAKIADDGITYENLTVTLDIVDIITGESLGQIEILEAGETVTAGGDTKHVWNVISSSVDGIEENSRMAMEDGVDTLAAGEEIVKLIETTSTEFSGITQSIMDSLQNMVQIEDIQRDDDGNITSMTDANGYTMHYQDSVSVDFEELLSSQGLERETITLPDNVSSSYQEVGRITLGDQEFIVEAQKTTNNHYYRISEAGGPLSHNWVVYRNRTGNRLQNTYNIVMHRSWGLSNRMYVVNIDDNGNLVITPPAEILLNGMRYEVSYRPWGPDTTGNQHRYYVYKLRNIDTNVDSPHLRHETNIQITSTFTNNWLSEIFDITFGPNETMILTPRETSNRPSFVTDSNGNVVLRMGYTPTRTHHSETVYEQKGIICPEHIGSHYHMQIFEYLPGETNFFKQTDFILDGRNNNDDESEEGPNKVLREYLSFIGEWQIHRAEDASDPDMPPGTYYRENNQGWKIKYVKVQDEEPNRRGLIKSYLIPVALYTPTGGSPLAFMDPNLFKDYGHWEDEFSSPYYELRFFDDNGTHTFRYLRGAAVSSLGSASNANIVQNADNPELRFAEIANFLVQGYSFETMIVCDGDNETEIPIAVVDSDGVTVISYTNTDALDDYKIDIPVYTINADSILTVTIDEVDYRYTVDYDSWGPTDNGANYHHSYTLTNMDDPSDKAVFNYRQNFADPGNIGFPENTIRLHGKTFSIRYDPRSARTVHMMESIEIDGNTFLATPIRDNSGLGYVFLWDTQNQRPAQSYYNGRYLYDYIRKCTPNLYSNTDVKTTMLNDQAFYYSINYDSDRSNMYNELTLMSAGIGLETLDHRNGRTTDISAAGFNINGQLASALINQALDDFGDRTHTYTASGGLANYELSTAESHSSVAFSAGLPTQLTDALGSAIAQVEYHTAADGSTIARITNSQTGEITITKHDRKGRQLATLSGKGVSELSGSLSSVDIQAISELDIQQDPSRDGMTRIEVFTYRDYLNGYSEIFSRSYVQGLDPQAVRTYSATPDGTRYDYDNYMNNALAKDEIEDIFLRYLGRGMLDFARQYLMLLITMGDHLVSYFHHNFAKNCAESRVINALNTYSESGIFDDSSSRSFTADELRNLYYANSHGWIDIDTSRGSYYDNNLKSSAHDAKKAATRIEYMRDIMSGLAALHEDAGESQTAVIYRDIADVFNNAKNPSNHNWDPNYTNFTKLSSLFEALSGSRAISNDSTLSTLFKNISTEIAAKTMPDEMESHYDNHLYNYIAKDEIEDIFEHYLGLGKIDFARQYLMMLIAMGDYTVNYTNHDFHYTAEKRVVNALNTYDGSDIYNDNSSIAFTADDLRDLYKKVGADEWININTSRGSYYADNLNSSAFNTKRYATKIEHMRDIFKGLAALHEEAGNAETASIMRDLADTYNDARTPSNGNWRPERTDFAKISSLFGALSAADGITDDSDLTALHSSISRKITGSYNVHFHDVPSRGAIASGMTSMERELLLNSQGNVLKSNVTMREFNQEMGIDLTTTTEAILRYDSSGKLIYRWTKVSVDGYDTDYYGYHVRIKNETEETQTDIKYDSTGKMSAYVLTKTVKGTFIDESGFCYSENKRVVTVRGPPTYDDHGRLTSYTDVETVDDLTEGYTGTKITEYANIVYDSLNYIADQDVTIRETGQFTVWRIDRLHPNTNNPELKKQKYTETRNNTTTTSRQDVVFDSEGRLYSYYEVTSDDKDISTLNPDETTTTAKKRTVQTLSHKYTEYDNLNRRSDYEFTQDTQHDNGWLDGISRIVGSSTSNPYLKINYSGNQNFTEIYNWVRSNQWNNYSKYTTHVEWVSRFFGNLAKIAEFRGESDKALQYRRLEYLFTKTGDEAGTPWRMEHLNYTAAAAALAELSNIETDEFVKNLLSNLANDFSGGFSEQIYRKAGIDTFYQLYSHYEGTGDIELERAFLGLSLSFAGDVNYTSNMKNYVYNRHGVVWLLPYLQKSSDLTRHTNTYRGIVYDTKSRQISYKHTTTEASAYQSIENFLFSTNNHPYDIDTNSSLTPQQRENLIDAYNGRNGGYFQFIFHRDPTADEKRFWLEQASQYHISEVVGRMVVYDIYNDLLGRDPTENEISRAGGLNKHGNWEFRQWGGIYQHDINGYIYRSQEFWGVKTNPDETDAQAEDRIIRAVWRDFYNREITAEELNSTTAQNMISRIRWIRGRISGGYSNPWDSYLSGHIFNWLQDIRNSRQWREYASTQIQHALLPKIFGTGENPYHTNAVAAWDNNFAGNDRWNLDGALTWYINKEFWDYTFNLPTATHNITTIYRHDTTYDNSDRESSYIESVKTLDAPNKETIRVRYNISYNNDNKETGYTETEYTTGYDASGMVPNPKFKRRTLPLAIDSFQRSVVSHIRYDSNGNQIAMIKRIYTSGGRVNEEAVLVRSYDSLGRLRLEVTRSVIKQASFRHSRPQESKVIYTIISNRKLSSTGMPVDQNIMKRAGGRRGRVLSHKRYRKFVSRYGTTTFQSEGGRRTWTKYNASGRATFASLRTNDNGTQIFMKTWTKYNKLGLTKFEKIYTSTIYVTADIDARTQRLEHRSYIYNNAGQLKSTRKYQVYYHKQIINKAAERAKKKKKKGGFWKKVMLVALVLVPVFGLIMAAIIATVAVLINNALASLGAPMQKAIKKWTDKTTDEVWDATLGSELGQKIMGYVFQALDIIAAVIAFWFPLAALIIKIVNAALQMLYAMAMGGDPWDAVKGFVIKVAISLITYYLPDILEAVDGAITDGLAWLADKGNTGWAAPIFKAIQTGYDKVFGVVSKTVEGVDGEPPTTIVVKGAIPKFIDFAKKGLTNFGKWVDNTFGTTLGSTAAASMVDNVVNTSTVGKFGFFSSMVAIVQVTVSYVLIVPSLVVGGAVEFVANRPFLGGDLLKYFDITGTNTVQAFTSLTSLKRGSGKAADAPKFGKIAWLAGTRIAANIIATEIAEHNNYDALQTAILNIVITQAFEATLETGTASYYTITDNALNKQKLTLKFATDKMFKEFTKNVAKQLAVELAMHEIALEGELESIVSSVIRNQLGKFTNPVKLKTTSEIKKKIETETAAAMTKLDTTGDMAAYKKDRARIKAKYSAYDMKSEHLEAIVSGQETKSAVQSLQKNPQMRAMISLLKDGNKTQQLIVAVASDPKLMARVNNLLGFLAESSPGSTPAVIAIDNALRGALVELIVKGVDSKKAI